MGDVEFSLEEVDGQIRRKRAQGKTPPAKPGSSTATKTTPTTAGKQTKAVPSSSSRPKPKTRKERLAARADRYAKLNELKKKQRAAKKKKKKPRAKKAAAAFKAGVAKSRATAEKQREFHEGIEKRDDYYGPKRALDQVKGATSTVGDAARDLAWASRLAGFDETGKTIGKLGLIASTIGSVASVASDQAKRYADREFEKDKGRHDPEMEPSWYEWATGTKSAKQQMMDDLAAARAIGSGAKLATAAGGDSSVSSKKLRVAGKSGRTRLSKKLAAKAEAQVKQAEAAQTAYAIDPDRDVGVREAKRYAKEVRRARRKRAELKTRYAHQTVNPSNPNESTELPVGTTYDLNTEWGRNIHKMEERSRKAEGDLQFDRIIAKNDANAEQLRNLIRDVVREQDFKDWAKGGDGTKSSDLKRPAARQRPSGGRSGYDTLPGPAPSSSTPPTYAPAIADGVRRGIENADGVRRGIENTATSAAVNSLYSIYNNLPSGTSSVTGGTTALPLLAAAWQMYGGNPTPRAQFNMGFTRHDPTPFGWDPP